jgi:hypothetical protein
MGWADCTWSQSECLLKQAGESKKDFCNGVYQTAKNSSCVQNYHEIFMGAIFQCVMPKSFLFKFKRRDNLGFKISTFQF